MSDLDKYLTDIGISTEEETVSDQPPAPFSEKSPNEPLVSSAQSVPSPLTGSLEDRCERFLVDLLLNFDPSYAVEVNARQANEVHADIFGGDPGKIIGRNGKTLAALEFITNTVINQHHEHEERVRVNIDVGGYKRRRNDRIRLTARKAISRVKRSGMSVEMAPMSAGERRIVHMEVSKDPAVESESSGEGRNRRVMIRAADQ